MQITAKIIQLLPPQTGEGKNGPWKKQDIIVETQGKISKRICIACWGDLADSEHLKGTSETLIFNVNIESREYNGRWYTDIIAWKINLFKELKGVFLDSGPFVNEWNVAADGTTIEDT